MLTGRRYAPFIAQPLVAPPPDFLSKGLPVENGTTKKLCEEAGETVLFLVEEVSKKVIPAAFVDTAMFFLKPAFKGVLDMGGMYFCELGDGPKPDFGPMSQKKAEESCDEQVKAKIDTENRAADAFQTECRADRVTCRTDVPIDPFSRSRETKSEIYDADELVRSQKPEDKAKVARLTELQGKFDSAHQDTETFKRQQTKCVKDARKEMDEKFEKMNAGTPAAGGNNSDKAPTKVDRAWKNGVNNGQILSYAASSESGRGILNISPKGVKVGALRDRRATPMTSPPGANFGYAQAEFYYDCADAWNTAECNGAGSPAVAAVPATKAKPATRGSRGTPAQPAKAGKDAESGEEAMWHLRWRARLRRYNAPFELPLLDGLLDVAIYANIATLATRLVSNFNLNPGNMGLRRELGTSAGATDADTYKLH